MDTELLADIASRLDPTAQHVDYLLQIAKPCVDVAVGGTDPMPDNSRFGGHPVVPPGFDWPTHDAGKYRFLGQINFAEIDDAPDLLPDSGLLALFYAYDEDGEIFWGDDGYMFGYYWHDLAAHAMFESPTEVPAAQQITLTGCIDIPRHVYLRDDWPFDQDALHELVVALGPPRNYLLGYPSFTSLAYDPTPGPEWMSLLTVDSLNEFDWVWHDGDKLMVFIETSKLAAADFSYLKSDAG